ncbi:hypothetical protein BDV29DRAFT_184836 [Aspergillus leporis]|uniref:Uncharacterized protein n=1 Tax=Aspergillus leporis TaxID=41062 RepID=A0A5N5WIB9_9EURO|nr:hypothetical protein BDV29DRAFT_184836 [Aspergillus leporis]
MPVQSPAFGSSCPQHKLHSLNQRPGVIGLVHAACLVCIQLLANPPYYSLSDISYSCHSYETFPMQSDSSIRRHLFIATRQWSDDIGSRSRMIGCHEALTSQALHGTASMALTILLLTPQQPVTKAPQ